MTEEQFRTGRNADGSPVSHGPAPVGLRGFDEWAGAAGLVLVAGAQQNTEPLHAALAQLYAATAYIMAANKMDVAAIESMAQTMVRPVPVDLATPAEPPAKYSADWLGDTSAAVVQKRRCSCFYAFYEGDIWLNQCAGHGGRQLAATYEAVAEYLASLPDDAARDEAMG